MHLHMLFFISTWNEFSPIWQTLQFTSVQSLVISDSLRPHESQHARPPCPSPTPRVYSNSCPSSWWCHPAISSSAVPFFFPQSLPALGSFPMSQLFTWGRQSTGVSASASVLPMNTQDWSPLGWTGWIFLQSKGLSRVFSITIVQKHQFFGAQLSSQSNSHSLVKTQHKYSLFSNSLNSLQMLLVSFFSGLPLYFVHTSTLYLSLSLVGRLGLFKMSTRHLVHKTFDPCLKVLEIWSDQKHPWAYLVHA